ncbi:MAG: thiamine-phosphate kinase [Candidatus Dormibacteria bacterium]
MSTSAAGLQARRFDDPGDRVDESGEERLLQQLVQGAGHPPGRGGPVIVGSGDDAAVWRPVAGTDVVLSQDAVVEGEDFRRSWITPWQLGRRCLAVALSDLAACGAEPAWCLVTVCAPESTRVNDLLALQAGLVEAAAEWGCALLGGDLSRIAGPLVVDVSVGGVAPAGTALRRDAGRPGDLLMVTGSLGRAAAGLHSLMRPAEPGDVVDEEWRAAQRTPVPRLREGVALRELGLRCAGDLSDGLLVDAGRTAAASGCAAELWLERLPVAAELAARFPQMWPELALGGGEDFELLVAVPMARSGAVLDGWPRSLAPLTVVGRLHEGTGIRLRSGEGGEQVPLPAVRSRHFG